MRRQAYPIVKRYYSFLWRLQSRDTVVKKRRVAEECFIDEFGWSVFARGFVVELVANAMLILVIRFLVGDDRYWSAVGTRSSTFISGSQQSHTIDIQLFINIILLTAVSTFISYRALQQKIKHQFNDDRGGISVRDGSDDKVTVAYRSNIVESGIREEFAHVPPTFYQYFKEATMLLVMEMIYNLLFAVCFVFAFNFQQQMYASDTSITLPQAGDSTAIAFGKYVVEFLLFRSPALPIAVAATVGVLATQHLSVFQTQMQTFDYAFTKLQVELINRVSSIDEQLLLEFPRKAIRIYRKSVNQGIVGRLLYNPLRLIVISLWYDFVMGF
ncbi:hypothetical protein SAMD00019534_001690 [Acytostelium subglobosum LB1]|uniref:hypothetical protein n=1 Tax=Acytostelium subglobosum LB1 TaxID=1410327 RepID=UPI000644881A|nr:hypothetical protein SAMD00019534_001690 [Acytostelium subglobosum LB1]GAM16994.1 hypothetical protein SAMD00019534_001690 [Acytostelium subglobosum LB1]|eukprot:XP_012759056.1 hypothetical protein SAMD00019534_001690 [Acytostelium subglobosum LB1]